MRRALGVEAVTAMAEHERAVALLAQSVNGLAQTVQAHRHEAQAVLRIHVETGDERFMAHDAELGTIHDELMRLSLRLDSAFDLINFTRWERLRWLIMGR